MQRYSNRMKCLTAAAVIVFSCLFNCSKNSDRGTIPFVPVEDDGAYIDTQNRLSITRFGITWLIYKDSETYEYGQFANGDYWVVGPVTIVGISPESRDVAGRTMNGSMLNPSPEDGNRQGYDSELNYDADLNAALNVSKDHPLILQNGSSLVSSISMEAADNMPQLKTASILTVLENAAPEGSFRPPYCGTDKTIKYYVSQLNFGLLKKLPAVADTPPMAEVERYFERPWIDHIPGWSCRMIHPQDNMENYGRDMANVVSIAALMLHLDYSDNEKRTLLIRFVQLGIDNFGIIQNGGRENWAPDGGHTAGRKWPVLFAGLILDDEEMKNIGQKSGDYCYTGDYGPGNLPDDCIHFGEDGQTFYVTAGDVAGTNSSSWDPDERNGIPAPYTSSDIGTAEWGIVHITDPYHDNKDWLAIYRQCCTAVAWQGFILAARIMETDAGAKTLWNHDALFDYQDRYMAVTADSGSNPEWRTLVSGMNVIWGTNTGWRSWDNFTENMWDEYRDDF